MFVIDRSGRVFTFQCLMILKQNVAYCYQRCENNVEFYYSIQCNYMILSIHWRIPSKDPGFAECTSSLPVSTLQFLSLPMYDSHSGKTTHLCCVWTPFIRCVIVAYRQSIIASRQCQTPAQRHRRVNTDTFRHETAHAAHISTPWTDHCVGYVASS